MEGTETDKEYKLIQEISSSGESRMFGHNLPCDNVSLYHLLADCRPEIIRYHVGESMLPSMRHFLRFIDLDSTFDSYGFKQKVNPTYVDQASWN